MTQLVDMALGDSLAQGRMESPKANEPLISARLIDIEYKLNQIIIHLKSLDRSIARGQIQQHSGYKRSEAALLLGVSTRTIDRMVRNNMLHAKKQNGHIYISGYSILNCGQHQRRTAVEVLRL